MNTSTSIHSSTGDGTDTETDLHRPVAAPNAPARSKRRFTRLAAMALAMISASTIGLISNAETSEAASGVTACFKTRTGMVVGPVTTHLDLYYNGRWNTVASKSNSGFNGCVTYTMTGWYQNYYARVRMAGRASTGDYFTASSPYWALPGNLHGHLGTANVSCVGFCYGV
jgi:hypothetical protein